MAYVDTRTHILEALTNGLDGGETVEVAGHWLKGGALGQQSFEQYYHLHTLTMFPNYHNSRKTPSNFL